MAKSKSKSCCDYGTKPMKEPVRLRTSEPKAEMPPTAGKLIPQRKQLAGMT
jgi:hypothetical protein